MRTVATAPALSAPAEHRIIRAALLARADYARRTAASRRLAGPELASQRAAWRAHARTCTELAGCIERAEPDDLARLLHVLAPEAAR